MCFAPSVKIPETPTPAPLPPPLEDAPKVESVDFGGDKTNTEDASGFAGKTKQGKGSLKIEKTPAMPKVTGANVSR
ncbi:MAG: putative phage head protein [Plesiomonas sp.]